jgi:hypothetical protein
MKTAIKYALAGISGTVLFVSGVAFGQAQERYLIGRDAVERAITMVTGVTPLNWAERRQRTLALESLSLAHDQITCAHLRSADRSAACP